MGFLVTESGSTFDEVEECVMYLQEGGFINVSENSEQHENVIRVNKNAVSKFQKIF